MKTKVNIWIMKSPANPVYTRIFSGVLFFTPTPGMLITVLDGFCEETIRSVAGTTYSEDLEIKLEGYDTDNEYPLVEDVFAE